MNEPEQDAAAPSWWPTFRSILITGGEIALKVLPILLAALRRGGDGAPQGWQAALQTGPVEWQVSALGGTVQLCNVDPQGREMAVTFCPPADDSTPAEVVLLTAPGTANATAPVTTEMETLISGMVGVTALPKPSVENGKTLVNVSYALGTLSLAVGAVVHFTGGGELYVYKQTPNNREEWGTGIRGGNLPQSAEVKFKHPGTGAEVSMKSQRKDPPEQSTDGPSIQFTIPPGVLAADADSLENFVLTYEMTHDQLLSVARQGA